MMMMQMNGRGSCRYHAVILPNLNKDCQVFLKNQILQCLYSRRDATLFESTR